MNIKLTVFFEDPFWVGVFERTSGGMLETARVVFGAAPKEHEIYSYILKNYSWLSFSQPVKLEANEERKVNPKRLQRIIRKETLKTGVGTKAQQALKFEHESRKLDTRKHSKENREEKERTLEDIISFLTYQ